MSLLNKILFTPQTLTDDQKRIARENIGAADASNLHFDEDTISGDGSQNQPYTVKRMEAATSQANGKGGIVPAPVGGDANFDKRVLCGNGEWNVLIPVTNAEIDEMFVEGVVIGGRSYPYVQIGNQLWLAENLDYKFQVNGNQLPIGVSGTPSTPSAWYYGNDEATYGVDGNRYGLLYNWHATKYLEDNKSTLLPEGWHVPSTTDLDALANTVGGASTAGTVLKSTTGWNSGNGTDNYGFSAVPAGFYDGSFSNSGTFNFFWTSTEFSSSNACTRDLNTATSMFSVNLSKNFGSSVRLVKDVT